MYINPDDLRHQKHLSHLDGHHGEELGQVNVPRPVLVHLKDIKGLVQRESTVVKSDIYWQVCLYCSERDIFFLKCIGRHYSICKAKTIKTRNELNRIGGAPAVKFSKPLSLLPVLQHPRPNIRYSKITLEKGEKGEFIEIGRYSVDTVERERVRRRLL
jgi:hypothetical protein